MDREKTEKELEAPPNSTETYVILPRSLNIKGKEYLLTVKRGDLENVKTFIESSRKDGVNSILEKKCVENKDALLRAIDRNCVETVKLLLEPEKFLTTNGAVEDSNAERIVYSWQKIDPSSARYPPGTTPLILAAQRNNYAILELLLRHGATLPEPHDIKCECTNCLQSARVSSSRHNTSERTKWLTAIQLSGKFQELAIAEPKYLELQKKVESFPVDLLQQVGDTTEMHTILNYDPEGKKNLTTKQLPTLELATQYKQKAFVADFRMQLLLAGIWYNGLPGFQHTSTWQRCGIVAKIALFFPIYCMMNLLAPESKFGQLMRKPFVKFIAHTLSYVFFLFILMLVSQRAEVEIAKIFGGDEAKRNIEAELARQRGAAPSILEGVVVLYVLGFIWQDMRKAYVDGLKPYLRNMWNFIDLIRDFLYIATVVLRTAAYLQQRAEISQDPMAALVPRETWSDFDPQLIAEGLFVAANIFSALKLIHLFSINRHLSLLQISLGRIVIDIVKFFFIYALVLFVFACGLNQLLWYFAELERRKCDRGNGDPSWDADSEPCLRWRRFSNLFESVQSLFWANFGAIDIENFELTGIKSYTRFWGLLIFGSYCVINVIVLLNLLIAIMNNSYAVTKECADTEWKFARTKLWMSYFGEGYTLPPPFNILSPLKVLLRLWGLQKKKFANESSNQEKKHGPKYGDGEIRDGEIRDGEIRDGENRNGEITYGDVMGALISRYFVNKFGSDLSSSRNELLNILDRNKMDIAGSNTNERTLATPVQSSENEEPEEILQQPTEGEDKKSSQIGKSSSNASLQSQLSLKKPMEEAQELNSRSPLLPDSPVELPENRASTSLHVPQDVEVPDNSSQTTLPEPPRLTDIADPDEPIAKPKPVSIDYVDEKIRQSVPLRTLQKIVKTKSANSSTMGAYQQQSTSFARFNPRTL